MWFWIILILVGVIILILLLRHFKNPRIESINISTGGLGSGKTSANVCLPRSILRKWYFLFRNFKFKNDHIILSSHPMGKPHYLIDDKGKFVYDEKGNKIVEYRYLKVWNKHIKCYDLNLDILIQKVRLPQDEVILIIDEFSKIASQFDFNNPVVKNNMDDFFTFFRHYTHGKGLIFIMDQCSENIFLQIRRRASYCYNFISCKKLLLLPITIYEYRKILLSDEVNNIIDLEDGTDEKEIRKFIFFTNPFKWYNSHCYYYRNKTIPSLNILSVSQSSYRNDIMRLREKLPVYYDSLKYDGITERDYYELHIIDSNKDKKDKLQKMIEDYDLVHNKK